MSNKTVTEQHRSSFYFRDWVGPPGADTGPFAVHNNVFTTVSSVSHDVSYSDWKERIAKGINATTELSGVRESLTLGQDGYSFVRQHYELLDIYRNGETQGCLADLQLLHAPDPDNFFIASVRNQVSHDIISQVRAANKSLQGLVAAGEIGETVRMINHLGREFFGRTKDYLLDLEKVGRRLTPQNITRRLSEKWLEYKFGVRPLVKDLGDFTTACINLRFGRPPRIPVRASASSSEKNLPTSSLGSWGYYFITTTASQQLTYGYRLYGSVNLTDKSVPAYRKEFGLTLDEFVPTLWELIPYSFLVDYVTNVGAIIDAYSVDTSSLSWLAQGELREGKVTLTLSGEPNQLSGYVLKDNVFRPGTPSTRTKRLVTRGNPSWDVLTPSLEFRIPGCSTQWLNIAALGRLHASASRSLRHS